MSAVLIYHQNDLKYIVLPNRHILVDDRKDLIGTILSVERHPFWRSPKERKGFYEQGAQFFKRHEDYLGSRLSMDDVDGKMSPGFFLYLTFNRFQNQLYQATMVNKSDLIKVVKHKLEKNNLQKSDETFTKLLALEVASEYLLKQFGEKVYSPSGKHQGPRGGRYDIAGEGGEAEAVPEAAPQQAPSELTAEQSQIDWTNEDVLASVADFGGIIGSTGELIDAPDEIKEQVGFVDEEEEEEDPQWEAWAQYGAEHGTAKDQGWDGEEPNYEVEDFDEEGNFVGTQIQSADKVKEYAEGQQAATGIPLISELGEPHDDIYDFHGLEDEDPVTLDHIKSYMASKQSNLSKLLILETALEYLFKANPGEDLEYIDNESQLPKNTRVVRTKRGAIGYFPSEIGKLESELKPDQERPIEVVGPAVEAKKAPAKVEEPDNDEDELVEGRVEDSVFKEQMVAQGFFAVNPDDEDTDDYLDFLDKVITKAEKQNMINEEAINLRVPATELVPIAPNLKIVDEEGTVIQITTTDGQLLAVQKIDTSKDNIEVDDEGEPVLKNGFPQYLNPRGKLHLHVNSEAPNDDPLDYEDNHIQYSYQDAERNKKSGYSLKYVKSQAATKFAKVKKLVTKIPAIKKAVKADFTDPVSGSKKRRMRVKSITESSLALALVLNTARRIGGPLGQSLVTADGKEGRPKKLDKDGNPIRVRVDTYGVSTLQARHIKVSKGGRVSLEFIGKSGKTNYVDVTDKMVASELVLRKKTLKPKDQVIGVGPGTVNTYLKSVAGSEFSAKNFRTYQGTLSAVEILDGIKKIPSHFGDYPIIQYKTKAKVPIEVKSTWGAEFNKDINKIINDGGIIDAESYKQVGLLWLLRSQYLSKRDFVARPVSEKLSNTPDMSLSKYIDPVVFDEAGWNDAFHLEQEEFLASTPADLADRIEVAQAKLAAKANK